MGDVPETLLWNCFVTPLLFDARSASMFQNIEQHYTPMAWTTLPFKHWRGSINYRFQIVASSFHKGRIKVVYEPYLSVGGATEYNTQYTQVIDLAKERDFTVTINWGQEYSFLDRGDFHSPHLPDAVPFDTNPLTSARHGAANGIIMVSVVNDLTTPSAILSDVAILVSVSAGDDYEVVNPDNSIRYATYYSTPEPAGSSPSGGTLNTSLTVQSASSQTKEYYRYLSTQAQLPDWHDTVVYDEQAGLIMQTMICHWKKVLLCSKKLRLQWQLSYQSLIIHRRYILEILLLPLDNCLRGTSIIYRLLKTRLPVAVFLVP